jgi:importin subunit beta-1
VACNPAYLQPLVESLVHGLTAEPRVASNVCWALSSLAEAAYEAAETDSGETHQTYSLSAFFDPIVQKLLEATGKSNTLG